MIRDNVNIYAEANHSRTVTMTSAAGTTGVLAVTTGTRTVAQAPFSTAGTRLYFRTGTSYQIYTAGAGTGNRALVMTAAGPTPVAVADL